MNTLRLIKARAMKTQAIDRARLLMAKAFGNPEHIATPSQLRCRGMAYEPNHQQQKATGGRELRFRGLTYGVC